MVITPISWIRRLVRHTLYTPVVVVCPDRTGAVGLRDPHGSAPLRRPPAPQRPRPAQACIIPLAPSGALQPEFGDHPPGRAAERGTEHAEHSTARSSTAPRLACTGRSVAQSAATCRRSQSFAKHPALTSDTCHPNLVLNGGSLRNNARSRNGPLD